MFNCSLDELLRQDIDSENKAYSNVRIETMEEMRYYRYAVVSSEPEDDAKNHMHGYCAACLIDADELKDVEGIITQPAGIKYIAI